jgi:hypothetical protein
MKRRISELPWLIAIILTFVFFVVSVFVSQLLNLIDLKTLAITGGLLVILVIISAVIGSAITRITINNDLVDAENRLEEKAANFENQILGIEKRFNTFAQIPESFSTRMMGLDKSINDLKQITQSTLGKSLISYDELSQLESSVEEKEEIWVLTSHLRLEDVDFRDIIIRNLKRGVIYKYLLPREDVNIQKTMISLTQDWQKESQLTDEDIRRQIQCYLVPKHLTYMTVVIYGPYNKNSPIVLVKFPVSEAYEKGKYPFIYRVDAKPKEGVERFIETLNELMEDQQYCPRVRKMPSI